MALSANPKRTVKITDDSGIVDKVNIVDEPRRRNEVDVEELNVDMLTPHAEGYRWEIDVYTQLSGLDNVKSTFDPTTTDPSQQYRYIKGFQLRLSSGIAPSQNVDDKVFKINGEGYDDFGLSLNEGDFFIAYTGNGQRVLFSISESVRLSTLKEASYQVSFDATTVVTDEILTNINNKVVQTYIFSEDSLEFSGKPLLTEEDYALFVKLEQISTKLSKKYSRWFTNHDVNSFAVPHQTLLTHDVFMTMFANKLGIKGAKCYNHPPFNHWELETILSLLFHPDIDYLEDMPREFSFVGKDQFYQDRAYGAICHTSYGYTIWSHELPAKFPRSGVSNILSPDPSKDFLEQFNDKGVPFYKKVTLSPYIFTESFYDGVGVSVFEIEVLRYLRGEKIQPQVLISLYDATFNLPGVEKFYYIPILILLVNYVKISR